MRRKYTIATIIILIYMWIMFAFIGCTNTKYIPIESIKTEYINSIERDTLIMKDSIFHKEKGDTVYIEKFKIIYKTKHKNDTVIINDTIPIIQEVEVIKEINKLKDWQVVLMILGGGMIAVIGYKIYKKLGVWLR